MPPILTCEVCHCKCHTLTKPDTGKPWMCATCLDHNLYGTPIPCTTLAEALLPIDKPPASVVK